MALTVSKGRIDVYKPTNFTVEPDLRIDADDILKVDIEERILDRKDKATISLDNTGGTYSGVVTSGDRLEFFTDVTDTEFGTGLYGEGVFGGSGVPVWTGVARSIKTTVQGPQISVINIECDDYVFGVLSFRYVTNAFEDRQIAGTPDSILNKIVSHEAPEIGLSKVANITKHTDITLNGMNLLDACIELAARGDAMMASRGTDLEFTPLDVLDSGRELGPTDVKGHYTLDENDDDLVNSVMITGGTGRDIEEEQDVHTDNVKVTDTSRVVHKISTRKDSLAKIDLYVGLRPNSTDGVTIRLQKDEGGAPIDIDSQKSDITNVQVEYEDLVQGMNSFVFKDHHLPETTSWLIIEASGTDGQEIGVDNSGVPTFTSWYPYPITVPIPDYDSQDEYMLREKVSKDESLKTFPAAEDKALSILSRHTTPTRTVSFEARTSDAYEAKAGELVTLGFPLIGINGDKYVLSEKKIEYENYRMKVNLTFTELASF